MYIGFTKFLAALAVVGVALGVVFGAGVAVGHGDRPAQVVASSAASGASGATGAGGAAGVAASARAGAGGGAATGAGVVNGQVDTVTPTSMVVRTASGQTVTLTLNAQTTVRKVDAGSLADVQAGDQVLVTHDASSLATSVQLVPPGTTFGRGGGARGGTGAGGSATPGSAVPGVATP